MGAIIPPAKGTVAVSDLQPHRVAPWTRETDRRQITADAVCELTERLDLKSCRYVEGPLPRPIPELRHHAIRVPANVDRLDRGQVALAVSDAGRRRGHFILVFPYETCGVSMNSSQRRDALALADRVARRLRELEAAQQ